MPSRPARHALSCCMGNYGHGSLSSSSLSYVNRPSASLHGTHHKNLTAHITAALWTGAHNAAFSLQLHIFSERDYVTFASLYAIGIPSVVCLSVVCDVGAPYSAG